MATMANRTLIPIPPDSKLKVAKGSMIYLFSILIIGLYSDFFNHHRTFLCIGDKFCFFQKNLRQWQIAVRHYLPE
jgi:hypothetical protein